jgi:hypothetical protein
MCEVLGSIPSTGKKKTSGATGTQNIFEQMSNVLEATKVRVSGKKLLTE